jgi:putative glutamine amidotransferase
MNSKPSGHPHGAQRRPVVGITPDYQAGAESGPLPQYELKTAYAEAVLRAGGLPMILPYSDDPTCVQAYLDRISALLVTGGAFDVGPEHYGEEPRDGLGVKKESRTRFEASLLKTALSKQVPVLAICGGMQLLNVVAGGSLYQDILREVQNARDHEQKNDRAQPFHPIEVKNGTLLSRAVGSGQLMVNSTHHQAVNRPGKNTITSALSPDGVVEAIELSDHPFALGVQWHPELLIESVPANLGVYRMLVQKAREAGFRR